MLNNRLLQCRGCRLKWFSRGKPAGACPACGGKNVGATLELFHVGIVLVVLAAVAWIVPSTLGASAGDGPIASAMSSVVDTKATASDGQRTRAAPAHAVAAHAADARATPPHAGTAPVSGVIKAKKLIVAVQRGPAKGHTVTLRRGDKVTILDRKDRRYLVRDRRGNQVYVPLDKLNLRQTAEKRRQYVQR
jgi:uncharacterized protein YgiM (DUF1202 family)